MSKLSIALSTLVLALALPACGRSPTRPSIAPAPVLPAAGAVLDNGRTDFTDGVIWVFAWSEVPNATRYELLVRNADAATPVLDADSLTAPGYRFARPGYIFGPHWLAGWSWKVRARTGGAWGPWSRPRPFTVEPQNTDGAPDDPPPPVTPEPDGRTHTVRAALPGSG